MFVGYIFQSEVEINIPTDSKIHEANRGPTWVLLAPDGPHEPSYQGID